MGCRISSLVLGLEGGVGFRSKRTEERWSRGCLDAGAVVDAKDAGSKVAGSVYHGNSTIAMGNGTA